MLKFVKFTDPHVMGNNPASRLDFFPDTILRKLQYVISFAAEQKADGIICAGDWLHRPDLANNVLRKLISVLYTSTVPIYTVIGNHEEYGYNPETVEKSGIGLLEASGLITRLGREPIFISDAENTSVQLTGVDAHFDLDKNGRVEDYTEIEELTSELPLTKIHVVHGFLCEREWPQVPCTTIDSILDTNADIILTGHEHSGFGIIKKNGKMFINSGALGRVTASIGDVNKEVQVAVIEINGTRYDAWLHKLPVDIARPANEVLDRDKLIQEKRRQEQIGNFIQNVSVMKVQPTLNIYNMLDSFAREENIPTEVIEVVRLQLQKAEEQLKKEE